MFGVVPQPLWSKSHPTDERNRCDWGLRSLLVEEGDRLLLVDCGMGDKQDPKFFSHYAPQPQDLDVQLAELGYHRDDITDVFLTHLHFDHCGGAIRRRPGDPEKFDPAFSNAVFWSTERHWKWATEPNPREKASFLKENIHPIEASGQLKFIPRAEGTTDTRQPIPGFPDIDVLFVDGHTESQMLPLLKKDGRKALFTADLLPATTHIPTAWVMGYDTRPLITVTEKERILTCAEREQWTLLFEHDAHHEAATVHRTEKGVRLQRAGQRSEFDW
jgi:glyoxylase-like metal-dependent hydrolase (beta-lactamase superfamily II)